MSIAHKISPAQERRITEALTRPSFELSPETPTVTWRALITHGLAYHGKLRERVTDERGHLVRSHGVMLTDAGVTEARRIAGDSTITREDVARAVEDAIQWVPRNARDEWAAKPPVEVLAREFKRAGQVWRKLAKQGGRVPVETQALKHYQRVTDLLKSARRFEAEDAADNASEVSARFAAVQSGTAVKEEKGMHEMSEQEHASAFGERFAEAQRARTEEAQQEERALTLEVSQRVVSYRAEACAYAGEDDHECESECTWMDGESRELSDLGTDEITPDADDLDAFEGDAVAWAVDYIRTKTDAVEVSYGPVGEEAPEHAWMHGTYTDPYEGDNKVTETAVRLTGDWTPQERARVFKAARP